MKISDSAKERVDKVNALIKKGTPLKEACAQAKLNTSYYYALRKKLSNSAPAKRKNKYQAITIPDESDDKITMTAKQLAQFVREFRKVD